MNTIFDDLRIENCVRITGIDEDSECMSIIKTCIKKAIGNTARVAFSFGPSNGSKFIEITLSDNERSRAEIIKNNLTRFLKVKDTRIVVK